MWILVFGFARHSGGLGGPGVVLRVASELLRDGLKVFIEHGRGVVTTSDHLGRSLVSQGQRVRRGEPVALSGSSGVVFLYD